MPSNNAAWNGWEIMETGIRGTMVANGDTNKQVWMTEMGAPTSGNGVTVSAAEQAQIHERLASALQQRFLPEHETDQQQHGQRQQHQRRGDGVVVQLGHAVEQRQRSARA